MIKRMFEILKYIFFQILYNTFKRDPDEILETNDGKIYLRRWYIYRSRKNSIFSILRSNIYIHQFLRSDEDRALHDHPWISFGMILSGSYNEYVPDNFDKWISNESRKTKIIKRSAFQPVYRGADYIHMIKLNKDECNKDIPVWTLFLTGEKTREWGFWCPKGWIHHQDFLDKSGSKIGKGCDD